MTVRCEGAQYVYTSSTFLRRLLPHPLLLLLTFHVCIYNAKDMYRGLSVLCNHSYLLHSAIPIIHLVIHLVFCVSLPQTLDPLSVAATTSDELLSSGHFQMPFDIVRDGEKQGMQAT